MGEVCFSLGVGRKLLLFLAIDGGASSTKAGLYDSSGALLREATGESCNPAELGVDQSVSILTSLARSLTNEPLSAIAAGISGARKCCFRDEIARELRSRLTVERAIVADDLHPILFANARDREALLTIAGTGSSILAQAGDGRTEIFGGRGKIFGDDGGAYCIAVSALRAAALASDGIAPPTSLSTVLPRAVGCNDFTDLAAWSISSSKLEIAALATLVDMAAVSGDETAHACIASQARRLALQTTAARLKFGLSENAVCFIAGSVFAQSTLFLDSFKLALAEQWPEAHSDFPPLLGHRAALALAITENVPFEWVSVQVEIELKGTETPSTERLLSSEIRLDKMASSEIVETMTHEDSKLYKIVARKACEIAQTIDRVAGVLTSGGRLIYAGAGTSGRLGVLDASECYPTFGVPRDRVIGIIAGGPRALMESIEGAEDDAEQGAKDLDGLSPPVSSRDAVVGIAASGRTPYTLGILRHARKIGAATVLLSCNTVNESPAEITIDLETGPEVLPGSTRLKAGTATKMVLNMISTGALARAGYVYEGRMTCVRPTNKKLHTRAVRIVRDLGDVSEQEAETFLKRSGDSIPVALIMIRKRIDAKTAATLLESAGGVLRNVLEVAQD
jgi:N-acetylmuramic acid 6-phosphate etherase